MTLHHFGELFSMSFMAFALGMDAFSVSLGLGMQQLRLKRVAIIGIIIGLTHMLLPAIGMLLGLFISSRIGHYTVLVGGLLLAAIGIHMIYAAFQEKSNRIIQTTGIGLIIFALSVSMDSFSVGLSLGMSSAKAAVAIIMFGFFSTVLTWTGLLLGRKMHGLLGVYSEIVGGTILFAFGLRVLFG
ncbi:MAG TPA: manganese efflux pump MntP family protein [Virgibacillus sp.]|nr:manganese efflux pump MntP family protein [Virgibacillus sp.]